MLEISWRPLCSNTILFEILLTKECGMLRIFLKHFAWKALSLLSSALLSHAVCKQYNNFESTQASKIRIFSALGRTAWFQTRHNVWNSALAAPKRRFSSGPILDGLKFLLGRFTSVSSQYWKLSNPKTKSDFVLLLVWMMLSLSWRMCVRSLWNGRSWCGVPVWICGKLLIVLNTMSCLML